MKSIIKFLVASVFLAACNKKLDVPPQNTVTPDQIKTADDVKGILFGAYATFQNANAFGEKYNTFGELLVNDGDINWAGTFETYGDLHNNSQVTTAPEVYQVWANSYHTINVANLVLNNIGLLTGTEKTQIEGEAKFFRGVAYYYLINFFAKPYSSGNTTALPGVPLILAPVSGYQPSRDKLPRATVEAVYVQLINDLTEAATKMPESNPAFRANKFSALAFLSRVYLSQGKYAEAATAANQVIESGEFNLVSTYDKAFNNASNSSEDIFAIQQTSQSNVGTADFGMATFYSADPIGRGELQISDDHLDKYAANDERVDFFYEGSSISGASGFMTAKYRDLYKAIPVIRLAEMYLTRAEANFRKGGAPIGPNTPVEDVNMTRERAGLTPLGVITNANQIVEERYFELAFEGDRYFTIKRLKLSANGHPFDFARLIMPIPQREIDLGNSTPQNAGY